MQYQELVDRINARFMAGTYYHEDFENKKGLPLEEVNAWTYWQGVGVRKPRIMVLGQDWGSTAAAEPYFKAIDEAIRNPSNDGKVNYFRYAPDMEKGTKSFATDWNLAAGLKILKYDDILHRRYPDLFFTNLIPGYRKSGKSTGGFQKEWITASVKEDFLDLLKVLTPQIVICLGKDTYQQAAAICGKRNVFAGKSWNDFLDEDPEPVQVAIDKDHSTYLFAMPHPGYFGVMNRAKSKHGKTIVSDWNRIADWLEKHSSGNPAENNCTG